VGACTAGRVYLFRLVAVIHDSERGHPVAGLGWTTPGPASVWYNHDPSINDYFIPRFDGVPHGGTLEGRRAPRPNWSRTGFCGCNTSLSFEK